MNIGNCVSIVLQFDIWFTMTVYYKTRQILLQNDSAISLQNASGFYYKIQRFYYKTQQLLKIATIFITKSDSYYKMRRLLQIATA